MKAVVLVIDSFGIGAMPDASEFNDTGANTAAHICNSIRGKKWPRLTKYGLGNASTLNCVELSGCESVDNPEASWGIMSEKSPGKDTTTGHWEIAGIVMDEPFHYFDKEFPSFPEELINEFVKECDIPGVLGNIAASGTEIIAELGEEHIKTKKPICYTSADSVFQIATHKDVYSIDELYKMCEIARKICDKYKVGRVIARPFEGKKGKFIRTSERHDWSIALPGNSLLDELKSGGVETIGIGKIGSIFNEQGLSKSYHDSGNEACIDRTVTVLKDKLEDKSFIFTNLVDTDMLYGHRRDVDGYHRAVDNIDSRLGEIVTLLEDDDLMIITADHGCDPTFKGTDHTREYVPLLVYRKGNKNGQPLGVRDSFADLSATIADYFSVETKLSGKSFKELIFKS